jgi:hypothetical protein
MLEELTEAEAEENFVSRVCISHAMQLLPSFSPHNAQDFTQFIHNWFPSVKTWWVSGGASYLRFRGGAPLDPVLDEMQSAFESADRSVMSRVHALAWLAGWAHAKADADRRAQQRAARRPRKEGRV